MRFRRVFSVAGMTVLCFMLVVLYALVQIAAVDRALRDNDGENNLWAVTQADREAQRLLLLLTDPEQAEPGALEFRLDILYSRVALMTDPPQSSYFGLVGAREKVATAMTATRDIADRIDAPGFSPAADPALRGAVADLSDLLRDIANDTVRAERYLRGAQHDQQKMAMRLLAFAVLGACVTGGVMAGLLLRNVRRSVRAQADLERHRSLLEDTVAQRTRELQQALAVERRAKDIYRSFIITVSHQFRTPVSIIHMVAQRQLRQPARDPQALAHKFTRILDAAQRLERLLAGIVSAAGIDNREVTLTPHPVDLNDVVRAALRAGTETAPARLFVPDLAPGRLMTAGDAALLEQVVLNLLSNAAKYSAAPAPIRIETRRDGARLLCRVTDMGIGIPDTARGMIFERFFRAPNVHRLPGMGVGLSLSRDIVALHGGTIGFESQEGAGAVFTISLPATEGAAHEPDDAPGNDPVHRGRGSAA